MTFQEVRARCTGVCVWGEGDIQTEGTASAKALEQEVDEYGLGRGRVDV